MHIYLNNSAISTLSCARRYQLTCLEGIDIPPSKELVFGSACHRAFELLDTRKDLQWHEVITAVEEEYELVGNDKLRNVILAFLAWRKELPPPADIDGKPFVEFKFNVPYTDIPLPPNTTMSICGTIDRGFFDKSGNLVLLDYKTAGSVKYNDVLREYALKFQLRFYFWALHKYHETLNLPPLIKDAIKSGKFRVQYLGIFHSLPTPLFKLASPQYYNRLIVDEVDSIVKFKAREAIGIALTEGHAYRDGMTNGACKYCDFNTVCIMNDETREDEVLRQFSRKPYDPMKFR